MFNWEEFWGNSYIDISFIINKSIIPRHALMSGYHKGLDDCPEIKLSIPIIKMFGYIVIE